VLDESSPAWWIRAPEFFLAECTGRYDCAPWDPIMPKRVSGSGMMKGSSIRLTNLASWNRERGCVRGDRGLRGRRNKAVFKCVWCPSGTLFIELF
jgi:hypothetical protein